MSRKPAPSGETHRGDRPRPLGLSTTDAAFALGATRKSLSVALNEPPRTVPPMPHHFARALDTTPASWVNLEARHDLWQAPDMNVAQVGQLASTTNGLQCSK